MTRQPNREIVSLSRPQRLTISLVRFALALGASTDELLGLKNFEMTQDSPSLRLTRRIRELERLPEQKKGHPAIAG